MDIRPASPQNTEFNLVMPSRLFPALSLLRDALAAANSLAFAAWEFAIEADQLRAVGLTVTDLRWLLCQGYVEHAQEQTRHGSTRRSFRRLEHLGIPAGCCFVLTAKGCQAVLCQAAEPGSAACLVGSCPSSLVDLPYWDAKLHQLYWRGCLVKEFRLPAPNQEAILAAFEEERWPARIDDPLPGIVDLDPKVRLHDAIKGLNRCQSQRLLRFRGDGTGKGIVWNRC
jgi:hypothetical protein